jgi:hypothetical protein
MSDVIRLHLNGGPRDDTYIDHWLTTLQVARVRGGLNTILNAVAEPDHLGPQEGRYEMRLDSNGNPVPHNLEGLVEADWKGWD